MRGWKTVERKVPTEVSFDEAVEFLEAEGFEVTERNEGHVITRRGKKANAVSMEKIKLEAAVEESEDGLVLQVRYGAFVMLDTGDLDEFADQLCSDIATRELD